jgi:hypothetical protein
MKTIIGFDGWTEGSRHFERLVPAFKRRGYQLVLIHIGSWGHDIERPEEEMIGDLCVRDISYYKNKGFGEILDLENPSGVLFMSTRAIAHMAFNRYARHKKIPTCHIYHGLVMVQALGEGEASFHVNYVRHINLFATRIFKNISKIIPAYIKSILETERTARDWLCFFEVIFRRGTGLVNNVDPYIADTSTDIGCVYTVADVGHMNRNYRIPLSDIRVVGNPDLIEFGVSLQDMGCALTRAEYCDTIIYIDTALVESGVVFDSKDHFIQHILRTRDELNLMGFRLVVKLHPAHYRSNVPSILTKHGIDLCNNKNFISELKLSAAAIVEPSTAAIIPGLLGVPILLAQYGELSRQVYGNVLTTYPRARLLSKLSDVHSVLSEERDCLSAEIAMRWIKINGGPMPAEDMPEKAVEAFCNLISTKT